MHFAGMHQADLDFSAKLITGGFALRISLMMKDHILYIILVSLVIIIKIATYIVPTDVKYIYQYNTCSPYTNNYVSSTYQVWSDGFVGSKYHVDYSYGN